MRLVVHNTHNNGVGNMKTKEFKQGVVAHGEGKNMIKDCPYPPRSKEAQRWQTGWQSVN